MSEEQFLRLERMIGRDKINLLHNSHVTVVGVGAVGSNALESLSRSGVGSLRLVDFDVISLSNINRQIIASYKSIGRKKVEVAKERVLDIYPDCKVEALDIFASSDTYELICKDTDIVLDCIDSLTPKVGLLEYCVKNNINVISSMGAALRRDPSLIRVAKLKDTWACPLARQVRTHLKRRGVSLDIDVIFSPEKVNYKYTPLEKEEKDEKYLDRGRRRVVLGSLSTITAIFGQYVANETLSYLVGKEDFSGEVEFKPSF